MPTKQPGRHRVAEQMRIDAFGDPRGASHIPDDLADALAGQHMRRWPRALLAAGEQRPGAAGADVQPQQLRQFPPHRHLSAFATLAVTDRDHALDEADILDPELHQFGGTGAGLQQGLQHQAGPPTFCVGLIEEAQFLLDGQPVDAAAPFGRSMQAGALPGGFEHFLALGVVDPLADEDGGDGSRGTRNGDHNPVCFSIFGVHTRSGWHLIWASRGESGGAERASSFPLRPFRKARLPMISRGDSPCA